MKYAHLADLHIGSWRDDKMRSLSTKAFLHAIDDVISKNVDFILFSGDIFNTPLPGIDSLKMITKKLRELHDLNIPLYVIAGSHDFSPSGKTMIDVLENAGLLVNVCKGSVEEGTLRLKFVVDPKTGAKITGMMGKKGMLDRVYYEHLDQKSLEDEEGYKIFMFHTALSELKPKHLAEMEAYPLSLLPKGFAYYAGGHVHHKSQIHPEGYGSITYPGALFPNNFAEVEKYSYGGYYLMEGDDLTWHPVKVIEHKHIEINCHHFTPEQIREKVKEEVQNVADALVTLRFTGQIASGKVSDLNFSEIFSELYSKGAYFVLKNINKLTTEEHEEIKIQASSPEDIEDSVIREHLQQSKLFSDDEELRITKQLLTMLNTEKKEGETVKDFEERVKSEMSGLLETYK